MRAFPRRSVASVFVASVLLAACGGNEAAAPAPAPGPSTPTAPAPAEEETEIGCAAVDLSTPPASPVTIRIGHGTITDAPLFTQFVSSEAAGLAHYGKWYVLDAQELSPGDRLAAYQAGALDAGTSAAPQMMTAVERGLNIRAVASLAAVLADGSSYTYPYLALASSGISGPADLRGKTVGIIAPNTSTEYWVLAAAATAGLDPERDLTVVSVPPPTAEEALRSGQVDVQFFSEAFYNRAIASGDFVEVFDARTGTPFDQEFLSIWFDQDFVLNNPEVYCAWAEDYAKAMRFYVEEFAAATEALIAAGYDPSPSVEVRLASPKVGRKIDGRIQIANFQQLMDLSVEFGFLELSITAEDVFIPGFSLTE